MKIMKQLKEFEDYQRNKENFKSKEASKKFGATLKGAGPIMQKMLQGLKTGDEEFDSAIEDMKSNLASINKEMIEAYLYDAVKNSNGQIKNIAVKKSLGAASVGQAFLFEIERLQYYVLPSIQYIQSDAYRIS